MMPAAPAYAMTTNARISEMVPSVAVGEASELKTVSMGSLLSFVLGGALGHDALLASDGGEQQLTVGATAQGALDHGLGLLLERVGHHPLVEHVDHLPVGDDLELAARRLSDDGGGHRHGAGEAVDLDGLARQPWVGLGGDLVDVGVVLDGADRLHGEAADDADGDGDGEQDFHGRRHDHPPLDTISFRGAPQPGLPSRPNSCPLRVSPSATRMKPAMTSSAAPSRTG